MVFQLRYLIYIIFIHSGFLTDVCVYQTATAAAELLPEMSTYVIADGCAAKSLDKHDSALKDISREDINVISTLEAESILAQCDESSKQHRLDGGDEWLMIDKIFSSVGVGKNESMEVDEFISLIGTMQSGSEILSTLADNLRASGEERLSRSQLHKILFQRKPRSGCFEHFPLFILTVYLPFLYSISTRIPFIFVALEVTQGRGRK